MNCFVDGFFHCELMRFLGSFTLIAIYFGLTLVVVFSIIAITKRFLP